MPWSCRSLDGLRRTESGHRARRGPAASAERSLRSPPTPEDLLRKAMVARSPATRGRHARQGLAARGSLDKTTHAMLLRQLYLSHYELRRFDRAHAVALQALELDIL